MAVKYRQSLIASDWKEDLHKYITGIVQNNGHKMIAINTMPDHLHQVAGRIWGIFVFKITCPGCC